VAPYLTVAPPSFLEPSPLLISLEHEHAVVWLHGEIGLSLAEDLTTFAAHLRQLGLPVYLEVSQMTFCDSTLANFLDDLLREVPVAICQPHKPLVQLLQIWDLAHRVLIAPARPTPPDSHERSPARVAPPRRAAPQMDTLIPKVAAGDHAAFEELYHAAKPRVRAIATRVVRNPAIASEAVQECFLDVWRLSNTFDPARGSAMAWIATIAHRRSVDIVRRNQSSVQRDFAYGIAMYSRPHQDQPGAALLDRLEIAEVMQALTQLTSLQRDAVKLAYFSGLTIPQIAQQLGVPISTLRTRVRDGLQRLRTTLDLSPT
jgi:RNA polymerase sigma-70 factor (ECF subfamily)